ncbi:hypothetical protein B0H16DRAFT_1621048 [Mycena metata]|uniref:Uncharacterized protein n=1 Tax=Mycena metata TaxID=1033252 RepID=A0AAD7H6A5_9AGAR|nr:hypothetical protein B0H16DRAFT_1621048 [Mycena metata]
MLRCAMLRLSAVMRVWKRVITLGRGACVNPGGSEGDPFCGVGWGQARADGDTVRVGGYRLARLTERLDAQSRCSAAGGWIAP